MAVTDSTVTTPAAVRPQVQRRPARAGYRLLVLLSWLGGAALVAYFVSHTRGAAVPAATYLGRWYGLIGFVLFLFLSLYGLRRVGYRTQVGRLEWWYRAHLMLGVVTLALLGAHCASPFLGASAAGVGTSPGAVLHYAARSPFLITLHVGFWGTLLTGILGWVWQTIVRNWMLKHEYRPAILKELDSTRQTLKRKLYAIAEQDDAREAGLTRVFMKDAMDRSLQNLALRRAMNMWKMRDWKYWEGQVDQAAANKEMPGLRDEARQVLRELNRVEVLRSYHRALRWWTTIHLLFTILGVQMMLWHVWLVSAYPR
jgi:hypothetical protein